MNTDFISKKVLIKALEEEKTEANKDLAIGKVNGLIKAINIVTAQPTIEVADVGELFPIKKGDTVWELCECMNKQWRIFPMQVKNVCPFGSVRWVQNEDPEIWHIYAESDSDYTYMYKSVYDLGRTLFLTKEEAEAELSKHTNSELAELVEDDKAYDDRG